MLSKEIKVSVPVLESEGLPPTYNDTVEEPIRPRRIIRRRRTTEEEPIIDQTLLNKVLDESSLPTAYNFEINKCLTRIMTLSANHVALQMPEGLLLYATVIADILQRMVPTLTQVSILGDVTYGACCVDDLSAHAMGANLLIHYGHSCLVPLQHSVIPCLYVFVELQIDVQHFVDCVIQTIPDRNTPLALLGTIQFRQGLVQARRLFIDQGYHTCTLPQAKPLSPGEVLGCTSPYIDSNNNKNNTTVLFCADGRFHLESTMISNPHVQIFLRYDPYSKALTKEEYAHEEMHKLRQHAIQSAQNKSVFGIVLGTLGRQGNPAILQQLQTLLRQHNKQYFILLLSEVSPAKLHLMSIQVQVWIQIACPRLSVDWGHYFETPVLSPYELHVALGTTEWKEVYPMDFYSAQGGPWANYHDSNKSRRCECIDDDGACPEGTYYLFIHKCGIAQYSFGRLLAGMLFSAKSQVLPSMIVLHHLTREIGSSIFTY
jgi:2-(3-amino-3-carboxypropyl)histidine synthase